MAGLGQRDGRGRAEEAEAAVMWSGKPWRPKASSRAAVISKRMSRKLDKVARKRGKGWGEGVAAVPRPRGDVRTSNRPAA
eukprot:2303996-Prymnesium_polylepis.1